VHELRGEINLSHCDGRPTGPAQSGMHNLQ